jgi:Tfp pilus assembly PilM family ATPase
MAPAADSVHATVPVEHAEPAPVVTSARAAYAEPRAESVVPETASPSHDDPAEAARTALIEGIRRIAVEVRNSLEFYVAQGREPVTRAVLCGPALQIEGFDAALSRELGIPVTQGTVALASPRSAGSVPRGMLAVAAGLSVIEGPQ